MADTTVLETCKSRKSPRCKCHDKIRNNIGVSAIAIALEKSETEVTQILQPLYNSSVIIYAMGSANQSTRMIVRFAKITGVLRVRKYFPNSFLKTVRSWNQEKRLIKSNATGGTKFFEIGEDVMNEGQKAKRRYYEQRKNPKFDR